MKVAVIKVRGPQVSEAAIVVVQVAKLVSGVHNLKTTAYSDGTPGTVFNWDAAGRNGGRVDAGGPSTLAYSRTDR